MTSARNPITILIAALAAVVVVATTLASPAQAARSADAERVLALRSVGLRQEIVTMDPDGTDVDLLRSGSRYRHVDWSDDHDRIAFAQEVRGTFEIFVMDPDGSNVNQVTSAGLEADMPAWSPDGSSLAFSRVDKNFDTHLWIVDVQSGALQQVTFGKSQSDDWADWHPNGDSIAFTSRSGGSQDVWEVAPDGSGLSKLTRFSADAGWASYSPDGTQIALTSWVGSRPQLFTMSRNGTRLSQITFGGSGRHGSAWSPDGKGIVSLESFGTDLMGMYADGSNQHVVASAHNYLHVSWN